MSALKLHNLTKTYPGGSRAVDDVSLDIHNGEFLVLVGPSGCGKSTTLRMIAGLEEISGGEIRIGERVVNQVPPKDRNISMVFQNYALYPHMTVRKNMSFGLELRYGGGWAERALRRVFKPARSAELNEKRKGIGDHVQRTAELLHISHLLDRMPKQLSGGERQRVALGRAIVREPEVFLFDEPLSNLDAKLRVEMRRELKQLHRRLGTTMIYVTHDQVEAMTLGDRVAVMRDGRLQQVGPPMELYDRPANRFVASFLGSPSMNLLDAEVVEQAGNLTFRVAGLNIEVPESWRETLKATSSSAVSIGIRPEDLQLSDAPPDDASDRLALPGEVLFAEMLGDSSLVTLRLASGHGSPDGEASQIETPQIVVKTIRGEQVQTGDRKSVIFMVSRMHLFAGEQFCRVEVGPG